MSDFPPRDHNIPLTEREFGESFPGLSEAELKILKELTEADKERIRGWRKNSLIGKSSDIVAIRTEDLFYFLECVHKGDIPVRSSPIRNKDTEAKYFFVAPNPENPDIKKQPDLLAETNCHTFREALDDNTKIYGDIGRAQAIYRNIISQHISPEELRAIAAEVYEKIVEQEEEDADWTEKLFSYLTQESKDLGPNCFNAPNNKPALYHLGKHLRAKGVDLRPMVKFLMNMGDRGSICVAFNKNLIDKHKASADTDITHHVGEFVVEVPNGELDLGVIYGFECVGEWEDDLLDKLGV